MQDFIYKCNLFFKIGITLDYGINSKKNKFTKTKYLKSSQIELKCNATATDSNNETNLSMNNLVINKHDLSSNTLSVDSGLSVPTATNSDPESEKSTNVHFTGVELSENGNLLINSLKDVELLDASRLKLELEKCQQMEFINGETEKLPLLKRQRRMLFLNSNSENKEKTMSYLVSNRQTK